MDDADERRERPDRPDLPGDDGDERFPNGDPPGPYRLPVVGNALHFFLRPFETRQTAVDEYGDVVDVTGLGRRAFLISHPEDVQRVLVTDDDLFVKPAFEKQFVERAFGDSLAFVDGERWRRVRTILQSLFTVERVESYGETMTTSAGELVGNWTDGDCVAVHEESKRLTFRVLARTLIGLEDDDIPDLHDDFEAVATKLRPSRAVVPDWIPLPTNVRYRRALARLEDAIEDLVADRRRGGVDGDDLLTLLIGATDEAGASLSDERIRDEMMGFLFAGHETTATALTFACYLLATHRDIQRRLADRIDAVLDGEHPAVEHLPELSMLDRVVDEALRLYPPNHMVPREATEDVGIGGYRIPEGASVYCSQWVVHRDDRWWDAPGEFRPERWVTGSDDRPEYAYFPFGGGPRHCIGMRFARLELRLALARLLSTVAFDGAPSGAPELAAGLTLYPKDPVELIVRRR